MGASGSKAAAVQRATSKAAVAAAPAAESAAAAAAATSARAAVPSSIKRQRAAELQARAAADPASMPAERAADNEPLVRSMNKVMAGMHEYQFEVYRNPEVDKLYALKRKTKEEKEADLVGRLASPALKALLEEHARAVHAGRQVSVDDLARRYGADPAVLRHFLQHNAGPVVRAASDGRLVGSWPDE
ncbi:hypothetical protein ABPG75_004465 [Micractinium tetrahymenae]